MTQVIATAAPTPPADPSPAPTAAQSTPTAGAVAVAPRQASLPTAAPTTNVIDYFPQRPDSPAQPGTCWTNSQVVPSRAAWRCEAGKQTLDPCFPVGDGQHVVCEPNPLLGRVGTLVKLAEPLPQPDLISERVNPVWLLQLNDGTVCRLTPGVTGVIGDKRITYRCATASGGGEIVILGEPRPGTVWQAERAVLPATGGQPDPAAVAAVPLLAVVRGPALYAVAACQPLADDLALLFAADVSQGQGAFTDPLTGQTGQACQITATAPSRPMGLPAALLLRKLMADGGWREDSRYALEKAGSSTFALRGGDVLCLAQVIAPQADSASAVTLNCARNISLPAAAPAPRRSEEVLFAPGATAATVRQPIAAGQVRAFTLRVMPGQTLILEAPATGEAVSLAVYRASDGGRLTPASATAARWQRALPDGGVYLIKIAARQDVADWALRIIVPVDLALAPGKALKQNGVLEPGELMYYLVDAPAGQRAKVTLTSPTPGIALEIATVEGSVILARGAGQTAWAGLLPAGPRGLLQIASGGQQAEYALEVVVE